MLTPAKSPEQGCALEFCLPTAFLHWSLVLALSLVAGDDPKHLQCEPRRGLPKTLPAAGSSPASGTATALPSPCRCRGTFCCPSHGVDVLVSSRNPSYADFLFRDFNLLLAVLVLLCL